MGAFGGMLKDMDALGHLLLKFTADYLILIVLLIGGVTLLLVPAERRYQVWARAVVAGMVALWIAKTASLFYHGERPFMALGATPQVAYLPDPGFPSDHALLVFLVTFVVWTATKNMWLAVTLLVMSIAVGVGRIVALVHTPLDIVAGFACALIAALGVYGRQLFTLRR